MSKKEINFYDFAKYIKRLGCRNALYLDGLMFRTYFPERTGCKLMEFWNYYWRDEGFRINMIY